MQARQHEHTIDMKYWHLCHLLNF